MLAHHRNVAHQVQAQALKLRLPGRQTAKCGCKCIVLCIMYVEALRFWMALCEGSINVPAIVAQTYHWSTEAWSP